MATATSSLVAAAGARTARIPPSWFSVQPILKSSSSSPNFFPSLSSFPPCIRTHRLKSELLWAAGRFEACLTSTQTIADLAETTAPAQGKIDRHREVSAVPQLSRRTFQSISTEQKLLEGIRYESEAKNLPAAATARMLELYSNYRDAVVSSGAENGREIAVQVMAAVLDRILLQFEEPFTFPPYHERMLDPYDYYTFGQNYVRPLIDFRNSYLGNIEIFDEIEGYLKEGHNVFLFANHQTEADPAVMALLLESSHSYLAENLTYIAGDRVVLDPLCKPFSMGRNLLCVYSKKRINDVPELVDMKQRANARTLKEMAALLKKGGRLIWIAPSGGRDRPDPVTGKFSPAAFDSSAVENMRRLLGHMPVPEHMYPMALLCHDIMPPPRQIEKDLGEKRLVGYSGVGLTVGSELSFDTVSATTSSKEEAREKFSSATFDTVKEHYSVLHMAVYGGEGPGGASPSLHLSQPWF